MSQSLRTHGLDQLCPTRGPFEDFVRSGLGFRFGENILDIDNLPYFDNLVFYNLYAGGPQSHFIAYFTIAVRIRTLSVH